MVRVVLASAVALSTAAILLATPGIPAFESFIRFQSGITTAGIWCLAFVGLLIVCYQIPVPAFTRAIILGYVPYLMVFTVYVDLVTRLGWGAIQNLNLRNAVAYDAVAGYCVDSAWRKDVPPRDPLPPCRCVEGRRSAASRGRSGPRWRFSADR